MKEGKISSWQAMLKNWKTTVLGLIPLIGGVAIALGWIDLEQQTAIVDGVEVVFDASDSILNEAGGVIAAVTTIIALFARDADKSSQDSGIR